MTVFWEVGRDAAFDIVRKGKVTPNPYRAGTCEHNEWEAGNRIACALLESEAEARADEIDALAPPDLSL